MVVKECPPGLRWRFWMTRHVLRDRGLGDLNTQLAQLPVDSRSAPSDVGRLHLLDELAYSQIDRRSTDAAAAAFPTPIPSKAFAMSTHNGIGVPYVQHRQPFTYFENNTQNKRSAAETRGRFTEGLSIASCWRSARFSSANWRRDWNREKTVVSTACKRLSMPLMLQQTQKNVNDFRPLRFTGGTPMPMIRPTSRSRGHSHLLQASLGCGLHRS
jgi:hypothetical protein